MAKSVRACALEQKRTVPNGGFTWDICDEYVAGEEYLGGQSFWSLSEVVRYEAYAAVNYKHKRAADGKCKFGPGKHNDVDSMRSAEGVFELKWSNVPPNSDRLGLYLRLYFAEPQSRPNVLLKLLVKCKTVGDAAAQTADARVAGVRLQKLLKSAGGGESGRSSKNPVR